MVVSGNMIKIKIFWQQCLTLGT